MPRSTLTRHAPHYTALPCPASATLIYPLLPCSALLCSLLHARHLRSGASCSVISAAARRASAAPATTTTTSPTASCPARPARPAICR